MKWKHNYYEKGLWKFIKDGAECFWHYWINHRILVCDIIGNWDQVQNKEYYIRQEYWTDDKAWQLHENGYKTCEGMPAHDNLAWLGVPVMVRLYNIKTIETDDKDNPMFLNDRINNNLLNKFARSLARAAMMAGMDLQKLLLMGGVAVAAIVGMKVIGVF